MDEDQVSYLNYEKLVDAALMNVVKSCLEQASKEGLKGDHHFYITFLTHHAGVRIPEYLKDQYPEEMTIVLQHQFENLEVNKEGFKVELVFDEEKEHIEIPFQAIVNFYDPPTPYCAPDAIRAEHGSCIIRRVNRGGSGTGYGTFQRARREF
jgi:hypothetical protein